MLLEEEQQIRQTGEGDQKFCLFKKSVEFRNAFVEEFLETVPHERDMLPEHAFQRKRVAEQLEAEHRIQAKNMKKG